MAKMRVHELAKELDIKSQDIIDVLSSTEFAVKSAQSGIEDAAQDIVRKKYAKTAAPVKEEVKKEEAKKEEPKKEAKSVEKVEAPAPKTEAHKEAKTE